MFIKIKPKTQRAKNRVREHGDIMLATVIEPDKICVTSLGETWHGETWSGWFTKLEADWEELKSDLKENV